ncbi:MAG: NB-ARC domain-containing protein [Longimicrobiaceae bacterium]
MASPARDLVFISYAHEDATWLERLQKFLKPYVRQGQLEVWADPYIKVGERWERKIGQALDRTAVGVLLISQDLLASDFVMDEELPALRAAEGKGLLTLFCIPISASTHEATDLGAFQWARSPDEPLDELEPSKRNRALVEITKQLVAEMQARPVPVDSLESVPPALQRDPVEPLGMERTGPLGRLLGIPELPPHYLPRREDLDRLKVALLQGTDSAVGITGAPSRLGLHGQGGIGKSVLAAALARDDDVRRAFPDGVLWVTLGQDPDLSRVQADLLRGLGEPVAVTSVEDGRRILDEKMSDRASLIIVDDAWDTRHARAFDVAGARSRLVVTTRDAAILTTIGAREESVERLPEGPALELLARWAGQEPGSLPDEARAVSRECGYVPLALSVAGARVRDGLSWLDLLDALQRGKLEFLDHPYASVFGSMRLGVDALPSEERRRYLELAVFPEDVRVPESVVLKLWRVTGGLSSTESKALLAKFGRKALLERSVTNHRAEIAFHDLQHDFLRIIVEDLPRLHGQFLNALAETLPRTESGNPAWHALPEDEVYPWVHLSAHLAAAGRIDEQREVLLDYRWLRAKLRVAGISALLSDLDAVPGDEDLSLLAAALRLAGHVLSSHHDQLPSQVTGRLLSVARPRIQKLIDAIRKAERSPWLRPLSGSLQDPASGLVRTIEGHKGGIGALAITPDGQRIVSGAYDKTLKVWDLESGREVHSLEGHTHAVQAVAVTPNGRYAVSDLKVWDLERGRNVRDLKGYTGEITALAITPDGRHAVSSCKDKKLRVWNLESGREVRTVEADTDELSAVAITPNGRYVVSGSTDRTLKVWDLESGREALNLKWHAGRVTAIAVTPDGRYVVSGSTDNMLKVWDLESGREVHELAGHTDWVRAVAITPDSRHAISVSDDSMLKVWDLQSGNEVRNFEGHTGWIMALAITPDGRRAVSGSLNSVLKIWDLEGGLATRYLSVQKDPVAAVAITPDGRHAVSGSEDRTLKIWNVESGLEVGSLEGHTDDVITVAITPDGRHVVSGAWDRTLKVWDLESGREVRSLEAHKNWVEAVAITPDGRHVVSSSRDRTLKVWDLESGREVRSLERHTNWVEAVAITPDGRHVVSGSVDSTLRVWDLKSGEIVALFTADGPIACCAVALDGLTIVAGDALGRLHFLRLEGVHPDGTQ